jgi:hypothetical protein
MQPISVTQFKTCLAASEVVANPLAAPAARMFGHVRLGSSG